MKNLHNLRRVRHEYSDIIKDMAFYADFDRGRCGRCLFGLFARAQGRIVQAIGYFAAEFAVYGGGAADFLFAVLGGGGQLEFETAGAYCGVDAGGFCCHGGYFVVTHGWGDKDF